MKYSRGISNALLVIVLSSALHLIQQLRPVSGLVQNSIVCTKSSSPCYRKKIVCPLECPLTRPLDARAKACFLDCTSPKCEATCKGRKPNCSGLGSGCYDPRFIGGDGIVFYFHGRKDEHFALVSDPGNLHINARFIGLRPAGRTRDFTWIQGLGLVLGNNNQRSLTIEAAQVAKWDDSVDHLRLSYNGNLLALPEGQLSYWRSADSELLVERTKSRNSVLVNIEGVAQILVNVVQITEEEDRVHRYRIPETNCFAHLEVQFTFSKLSPEVEGVLGKTYRPDYASTAKAGVAMAVVGGEDKYRTSSLLSTNCKVCRFSSELAAE